MQLVRLNLWLIEYLIKRYNKRLDKTAYPERLVIIKTPKEDIENFPKLFNIIRIKDIT